MKLTMGILLQIAEYVICVIVGLALFICPMSMIFTAVTTFLCVYYDMYCVYMIVSWMTLITSLSVALMAMCYFV
jgi:hypothetical protein